MQAFCCHTVCYQQHQPLKSASGHEHLQGGQLCFGTDIASTPNSFTWIRIWRRFRCQEQFGHRRRSSYAGGTFERHCVSGYHEQNLLQHRTMSRKQLASSRSLIEDSFRLEGPTPGSMKEGRWIQIRLRWRCPRRRIQMQCICESQRHKESVTTTRPPDTKAATLTIKLPARVLPETATASENANDDHSCRIFCPDDLRVQLVDMVELHFCAHPLIPGYAAPSAPGIRHWAVKQMYDFCVANDLREAWAYLWENWYRKGRWELWARCEYERIPRLKTTMILESQ